jgi:flagellar secretion chaperone FliS
MTHLMNQQAHESYIEAQVLTATPQKLRLMLIEAAIRHARQAVQGWDTDDNERALESIIHCRSIISELLSSIRADDTDLTKQVASLYLFVFQHLTEAQLRRDSDLLVEVIDILEVERGTWQQVCEEMPEAPIPTEEHIAASPQEILAPTTSHHDTNLLGGSFTFEA